MTDREDRPLLERLRSRDEDALADLYDLMAPRAFGLAYQVLGDRFAAEDVVQTAFVTVWEQAGQLDSTRGSIEGYLLTIVHRRAVDALRVRMREQSRSGPLPIDPPDGAASALDRLVAGDRADQVRAALGSLPEAQYRIVTLAYYRGLTQQQIAEQEGVPLGTVKSRLRLAMEHLRDSLGASEDTPSGAVEVT